MSLSCIVSDAYTVLNDIIILFYVSFLLCQYSLFTFGFHQFAYGVFTYAFLFLLLVIYWTPWLSTSLCSTKFGQFSAIIEIFFLKYFLKYFLPLYLFIFFWYSNYTNVGLVDIVSKVSQNWFILTLFFSSSDQLISIDLFFSSSVLSSIISKMLLRLFNEKHIFQQYLKKNNVSGQKGFIPRMQDLLFENMFT